MKDSNNTSTQNVLQLFKEIEKKNGKPFLLPSWIYYAIIFILALMTYILSEIEWTKNDIVFVVMFFIVFGVIILSLVLKTFKTCDNVSFGNDEVVTTGMSICYVQ